LPDTRHRFSFSFRASGLNIRVATDSAALTYSLDRYLLPWLPRVAKSSPKGSEVVYSVDPCGNDGCFKIQRGARTIAHGIAANLLFTALQQILDDLLIARLGERAAVHAGVAVYQGHAILLPGSSGSGKTTLVRELISRGARYSSDEFAVLDSDGLVHPWPRALMIRNACQIQEPLLATELGAKLQREAARVKLIVLLRYVPGATFDVQPLAGSETMIKLLQNTPHVLAEKPGMLGTLAAACRTALSFEGVRGAAGEAAEALIGLCM